MRKEMTCLAAAGLLFLAGCQEEMGEADGRNAAEETAANEEELSSAEEKPDEKEETNENQASVDDHTENPDFQYEVNPGTHAIEPLEGTEASSQVALLTIDDAPDGNAVEMAEILAENNASAIFFVNGMYLESEEGQEALEAIHELGFEIGNHTYSHPSLPDISPEEQLEEIVSTSRLVEEITGEAPRFFRAPFGLNTPESESIAADEGMTLMNWTYGYDWETEYQEAEPLADMMVHSEFLNHGANLLMHDRSWTKDALEEIVLGLREKEYEIVDPALIQSSTGEEEN